MIKKKNWLIAKYYEKKFYDFRDFIILIIRKKYCCIFFYYL